MYNAVYSDIIKFYKCRYTIYWLQSVSRLYTEQFYVYQTILCYKCILLFYALKIINCQKN